MNNQLPEKLQPAFTQIFNSPVSEFIQGQRDAENDVPHVDKSEDYTRGYNAQKTLEAVRSAKGFN